MVPVEYIWRALIYPERTNRAAASSPTIRPKVLAGGDATESPTLFKFTAYLISRLMKLRHSICSESTPVVRKLYTQR